MKHLRSVPFLVVGLLAASACPGGLESSVCKQYFEESERCAAKAEPARAEQMRAMVKLVREGFQKQPDKPVEESCTDMLAALQRDTSCR